MKNTYDVIVVGGGASGMMAAGRAAERGKRVLLLEKNITLGEKLKITGGGRCNITNAEEDEHLLLSHYGSAQQFLYSSFSQFGMKDVFSFFEARGLSLVIQAEKRAFPATEKATDVFRVLDSYLKKGKVDIRTGTPVREVLGQNGQIEKIIAGNQRFSATSYIFATGGKSHPETGSTGDGFGWLRKLGHNVQDPTPTIVPLKVHDAWIKNLAGVSIDSLKITFFLNDQKQFLLKGRILFTHFGLSGPLILNSAGKVGDLLEEGTVTAQIDLFPELDLGSLDKKVIEVLDSHKNKLLKNVLKNILPEGTSLIILSLLQDLDPEIQVNNFTKETRKRLVHLLKKLPVHISGLMGFERAVVADGGISVSEINGKTMQSRLYSNLFVTGDLLHINRPSGGYSLQLCWTTGYVAGNHA